MDTGDALAVMDDTFLAVLVVVLMIVGMAMRMRVVVMVIMVMMMMIAVMMSVPVSMGVTFFDNGLRPATAYRAHQITSKSLIFNSSPAVICT